MSTTAFMTGLVIAWVLFPAPGCTCQSQEPEQAQEQTLPPEDDAGFRVPRSAGEPALHDGEALTPDQRQIVEKLLTHLRKYYPVWDPARESADEFYERWYDAPEIERFKARIRRRITNDHVWPVLLDDVQRALGREFKVFNGAPPMFYIPSLQIVIWRRYPHGSITMVFRLSMLARLYDYYEHIRDPQDRWLQTNLEPGEDTADIAWRVSELIAEHYPEYRVLPPELGSVRAPNMKAENHFVNESSLADLLFEGHRGW